MKIQMIHFDVNLKSDQVNVIIFSFLDSGFRSRSLDAGREFDGAEAANLLPVERSVLQDLRQTFRRTDAEVRSTNHRSKPGEPIQIIITEFKLFRMDNI
jgi:hypothetical protein